MVDFVDGKRMCSGCGGPQTQTHRGIGYHPEWHCPKCDRDEKKKSNDRAFSTGWSVVKANSEAEDEPYCPKCKGDDVSRVPNREGQTEGDMYRCNNMNTFHGPCGSFFQQPYTNTMNKGMFENPGGFGAGECTLCGEPFNGDNPSYESKEGNAFCKGCFRDRWRVE